ncbi:MAG: hypothetical protein KCHDKBKB_00242 [Elusimicrobia bacterium]|nr:hypothetical protein [Elusimicrobiota bacterium]
MRFLRLSRNVSFLLILCCVSPSWSTDVSRIAWEFDETYQGPYQNSFNKLRNEVPILMRQTMIDLAVRCGLSFYEGWQIPLVVRFSDQAPFGVESILAYVQMQTNARGEVRQELVINLKAYETENFNFDKVFAHELVHAMLNDSLGVASVQLPVWFHEGLAVYGANQGENLKLATVGQMDNATVSTFINGLEGAHGALDYLEDYLAFKYIHDKHGINSLHNFIREIISRKGDIPGALEYTCLEDWNTFLKEAKTFAEKEVAEMTRSYQRERAIRPY